MLLREVPWLARAGFVRLVASLSAFCDRVIRSTTYGAIFCRFVEGEARHARTVGFDATLPGDLARASLDSQDLPHLEGPGIHCRDFFVQGLGQERHGASKELRCTLHFRGVAETLAI